MTLLRAQQLTKTFITASGKLTVLDGVDFEIAAGEMVAVTGHSGCGKSTLLHLLGSLDQPTTGQVLFDGRDIAHLNANQAAEFRNRELGFVWQFHYLLPEFTALENVAMPLLARGVSQSSAHKQAAEFLAEVGLTGRVHHRAGELSGGEQQRAALARALVTRPRLLLADEPTGDLDNSTAEKVFTLVADLHRTHGLTSVVATHNEEFAERCSRRLKLQQGKLTTGTTQVN